MSNSLKEKEKEQAEQLVQQLTLKKKKQLEEQQQQELNQQLAQQQQIQAKPTWTNDHPNADMIMKGTLKKISEQELKNAGVNVKKFTKTKTGFKFKLDDDNEIEVNGNRVFIKNHSQETFDAVAKTLKTMGAKSLDLSPMANKLKNNPDKEDILYRAFKSLNTHAPALELKGFGKDSAGNDLAEKFANKLKAELDTAPKLVRK